MAWAPISTTLQPLERSPLPGLRGGAGEPPPTGAERETGVALDARRSRDNFSPGFQCFKHLRRQFQPLSLCPFLDPRSVPLSSARGWRHLGRGLRLINRLRRHLAPIRRPRGHARPVSCASPPDHSLDGDGNREPDWALLKTSRHGRPLEPIPGSVQSGVAPAPKPCRMLKTSRPSPFFSVSTRPREGLKRPLPSAR